MKDNRDPVQLGMQILARCAEGRPVLEAADETLNRGNPTYSTAFPGQARPPGYADNGPAQNGSQPHPEGFQW